ncbi:MAG: DUF547 domain-containing protein [Hyphomonadaceae bacterium]
MLRSPLKTALLGASAALLLGGPLAVAETISSTEVQQLTQVAETSQVAVSYQPITDFTSVFATEQRGRMKIAYATVATDGAEFMAQYTQYLSNIAATSLSRDDQLAYWLNTRNWLVVQAMSESRNRRRVSRHRGTAAEPGEMWAEKRITVEGVELSIDDIERGIILTSFNDDPNVLYGLYQGSAGGASFPKEAFTGAAVRTQLEDMGREFVNSRSGVKASRSKIEVPAIYDWYSEALFGGDVEARNAHLISLSNETRAERFATATQFKSRKYSYSNDEFVVRQQGVSASSSGNTGGGGGGGSIGGGGGS